MRLIFQRIAKGTVLKHCCVL